MRHLTLLVLFFLSPAARCHAEDAPDRPNILWITSEDNAAQWLGCYGNQQAKTPRLDALAQQSVLFEHAYSNAPVCAVARSTLLNGVYAVTLGTQHMRSRHKVPSTYKPYVTYLREAGYYCTNNLKTDYNQQGKDGTLWDDSSKQAHYRNRPEGSPFLAIFNLTFSHESSLFPKNFEKRRQQGTLPKQPRIDPADIEVPPYLPDLPEVRSDFATYHDTMTEMDRQVGKLLDELEREGLADNTIVFYYSDHGGPTPRGKRYLHDTGVKVPLLIHVPERYRELSPFANGSRQEELVAFVDFAPTLLSICGLEKPEQMQGRAFLGEHRQEASSDDTVFLYGDRFDELIGMRRGITDGRYKYVRRFLPHLPAAPYSYYQFSMPSWTAWKEAWEAGTLEQQFAAVWEAPQPTETLYDTQADPWEVKNLADDPSFAEVLAKMRGKLVETMQETRDTGLIPEGMFQELAKGATINEFAASDEFQVGEVLALAMKASETKAENLPELIESLKSDDPLLRYWSATGCVFLGKEAAPAAEALEHLANDLHATNRIMAARALYGLGNTQSATKYLIAELDAGLNSESAILLMNTLTELDLLDEVPASWVQRTLDDVNANEYLRRFGKRLKGSQAE